MTPLLRFLRLIAADLWRQTKEIAKGFGIALAALAVSAAVALPLAWLDRRYHFAIYLVHAVMVATVCWLLYEVGSGLTRWIGQRWKDSQS